MNKRRVAVAVSIILAVTALLYLGGVLGQLLTNYESWLARDGILGQIQMEPVDWNPITCFPAAFSLNGLKGMALITVVVGGLIVYFKLQGRFHRGLRHGRLDERERDAVRSGNQRY